MKTKQKKEVKLKKQDGQYIVSLTLNGKKYNVSGNSIGEAVSQIPSQIIKEKVVIRVEKDGKKIEKMFYPFQCKKLLISKLSQDLFEKRLFF